MGPPPTRFEDLPARPPTPPRESANGPGGPSGSPNPNQPSQLKPRVSRPRPDIYTPPDDPPSPGLRRTSSKSGKRVGFSSWTEYHKAHSEPALKPLPPSRESRSVKSILKPSDRLIPFLSGSSDESSPGQALTAHSYTSFAAMLESVAQQLASESRTSRLDAYITIVGTLKACSDVPDAKAMADKMGLFMQFIWRDLSATLPGSGSVDTTVVTHALKFLTALAWNPQLGDFLTDDFRNSVFDHAISILENPDTPKQLVNQYLVFFSEQKFAKAMTTERANRLLKALSRIDDHVKGNGVIGARLAGYSNILRQSRPAMITRIDDWIGHLFSGMLSGIKEIQTRAISFGLDAGLALGANAQVSRAVMDSFNKMDNGRRNADYLSDRLTKMMLAKETALLVPQIWSVVVLFLRCPNYKLENWEHMKLWFLTIQKCFNSSDVLVKSQANIAWNKLVFAVLPSTDTSPSMVKMLRQPLSGQLERKTNDRHAQTARQVALSSYCNLLYYSLRPSASFEQLDMYWKEYVSHLVHILSQKQEGDKACEILSALFDATESKRWIEERATEAPPLEPSDLPRLDPKWVRSRIHLILKDVEQILKDDSWGDEGAAVCQLWRNLLKTIADAGSKEVKVSQDLREALAQLFNLFQRIWRRAFTSLSATESSDEEAFARGFAFIIQTTMNSLGDICFTEKFLSQNPQNKYEAAPTPSTRLPRPTGEVRSPVLCLIQLLLEPSAALNHISLFQGLLKELLAACASRGTRKKRLDFLKDVALMLRSQQLALSTRMAVIGCWDVVADVAKTILAEHSHEKGAVDNVDPPGHEYRDVVKILDAGLKLQQVVNWHSLFDEFMTTVRSEAGDAGSALAVIEPLAEVLQTEKLESGRAYILAYASTVLNEAVWPRDRLALERAKKILWGIVPTTRPSASFDPFNHLYTMINTLLERSYLELGTLDSDSISLFLTAVAGVLRRCPDGLLAILLKRVQEGLQSWIEDPKEQLRTGNAQLKGVAAAVTAIWEEVLLAFKERFDGRTNSILLQNLDILVSSGLLSKRKSIVNSAIDMWNNTFGVEFDLVYPDTVKAALARLRPIAELQLPNFPDTAEEEIHESPPVFSDSQDEADIPLPGEDRFSTPAPPEVPRRLILSAERMAQASSPTSVSKSLQLPGSAGSNKRASTPRLRHDDSQIAFAAIDSSPLGETGIESQLLTERQKEVKERQQAQAAAMFPDLRSSAKKNKARTDKSDLPLFTLSSDLASTGDLPVDGSTTPPLPPPSHGPLDDYVASSPTPSKLQATTVPDSGPPSSPPQVAPQDFLRAGTATMIPEEPKMSETLHQPTLNPENLDGSDVSEAQNLSQYNVHTLRELQEIAAEEDVEDINMQGSPQNLQVLNQQIASLESSLESWDKEERASLEGLAVGESMWSTTPEQQVQQPQIPRKTISETQHVDADLHTNSGQDLETPSTVQRIDQHAREDSLAVITDNPSTHGLSLTVEASSAEPQKEDVNENQSPSVEVLGAIEPGTPSQGLESVQSAVTGASEVDEQHRKTDAEDKNIASQDSVSIAEGEPVMTSRSSQVVGSDDVSRVMDSVIDVGMESPSPQPNPADSMLSEWTDKADQDTPTSDAGTGSQDFVRRSTRKRKRSSLGDGRRQKRKGGHSRQRTSREKVKEEASQQTSQAQDEEEILDCIVVDTSARSTPYLPRAVPFFDTAPSSTGPASPEVGEQKPDKLMPRVKGKRQSDAEPTDSAKRVRTGRKSVNTTPSSSAAAGRQGASRRRSGRTSGGVISSMEEEPGSSADGMSRSITPADQDLVAAINSSGAKEPILEAAATSPPKSVPEDEIQSIGETSYDPTPQSSLDNMDESVGQNILERLKSIKGELEGLALGQAYMQEIDDVLHDIRGKAREAIQRSIS